MAAYVEAIEDHVAQVARKFPVPGGCKDPEAIPLGLMGLSGVVEQLLRPLEQHGHWLAQKRGVSTFVQAEAR